MKKTIKCLLLITSLFNLNYSFAGLQQNDYTLVYSGNLNGELEPCGCAEESDLGGIKRRASMIQILRSQNPDMFLFTSGGLLSSESPRDQLKSKYILKGIKTMGYDAIGVQWRDLAYGANFIKDTSLPWISSNWHDSTFLKQKLVTRNKLSIVYFNWLDPKKSPQKQMQGTQQVVNDNKNALADLLKQSKQKNYLTVLMTTLSLKKARKRLPLELIDILLIRAKHEIYTEPKMENTTWVLQPGSRGMRLGKITLSLNEHARIDKFKHEVIPLPDSVPDAENLKNWYEQYNAKVKEDYLKRVAVRKKLETGESPFAGEEICKTCHANEYKIWQNSKHARAFDELEAVNKAFDPDCIGCHTVGFEKKGGFIDTVATAHLLNVQCESCHGASQAHAKSGGTKPVGNAGWPDEKICQQCHVGSHSPNFKFESYWPKIAHKRPD